MDEKTRAEKFVEEFTSTFSQDEFENYSQEKYDLVVTHAMAEFDAIVPPEGVTETAEDIA